MNSQTADSSLKAQLDGRKNAFSAEAPGSVKKIYAEVIQAVLSLKRREQP
jgi:hypothetical protein